MASDVKFTVNKLTGDQVLIPATISEDLEQRFLKKAKSSSIKLIPVSFIVATIVIVIAFLLIYFLKILAISTLGLISIVFPIYAIYDAFATSKAIKNHDYEFLYGVIVGKADDGSYHVRGLEDHKISPLLGKKDYSAGDTAIIARIKDDLNLISEE